MYLFIKNLRHLTWNEPNEIPFTQQTETKHRLEMLENGTMKSGPGNLSRRNTRKRMEFKLLFISHNTSHC